MMSGGSLTSRSNENGRSGRSLSRRKWFPNEDWRPGRRFGGIGKESYCDQTLNSELYCQTSRRPTTRRGIVVHQNNNSTKLRQFGWEFRMGPPYIPELAQMKNTVITSVLVYHEHFGCCRIGLKRSVWKSIVTIFPIGTKGFYYRGSLILPSKCYRTKCWHKSDSSRCG